MDFRLTEAISLAQQARALKAKGDLRNANATLYEARRKATLVVQENAALVFGKHTMAYDEADAILRSLTLASEAERKSAYAKKERELTKSLATLDISNLLAQLPNL